MKKKIVTKQDLEILKSDQKFYKAEYRDCNGETIQTLDTGFMTFEAAEEFAATNCPKDRFIETFDVVPIEPDIDCKQLPINIGFPKKMEEATLNLTTGIYEGENIASSNKKYRFYVV